MVTSQTKVTFDANDRPVLYVEGDVELVLSRASRHARRGPFTYDALMRTILDQPASRAFGCLQRHGVSISRLRQLNAPVASLRIDEGFSPERYLQAAGGIAWREQVSLVTTVHLLYVILLYGGGSIAQLSLRDAGVSLRSLREAYAQLTSVNQTVDVH